MIAMRFTIAAAALNGVLESNFDDGEVAEATRVRSEWCVDGRAACTLPSWRLGRQPRCPMQFVAVIHCGSRGVQPG